MWESRQRKATCIQCSTTELQCTEAEVSFGPVAAVLYSETPNAKRHARHAQRASSVVMIAAPPCLRAVDHCPRPCRALRNDFQGCTYGLDDARTDGRNWRTRVCLVRCNAPFRHDARLHWDAVRDAKTSLSTANAVVQNAWRYRR